MEIRELRYFLAIAQAESISRASQTLFVTQPNLSRQMQNLENELGQKLFIRGTKKLVLTEEGKLLKQRAEEILDLVDKTKSEFSLENDIKGTITIGGGESYAVKLIAEVAKKIQCKYSEIKLSFFSGDTNDVMEKLDKGLLDFGILIEPSNIEKYQTIRLPLTDTWGVLMLRDCELAQKNYVTAKDLQNLPLIFSKHSFNENIITQWLGSNDKLNIVATYNLLYNASLMVEAGIGYAVGLDKIINTTGNSKLSFRPLQPKLQTHLNIAWKKDTIFSKPAQLFLQELQNELNYK